MEKIEEQYQKIINSYNDVELIENSISHIRIKLPNNLSLDITYHNYPKKPKINLIKPNGQIFKNLDKMVSTLKTWKKNSPPSILNLINEIKEFIKNVGSNEIIIKKELIEGLLAICRHQHPREILGLLRVEKNMVSEFILPPGATTNESSGVFFPGRIPMDPSLEGTVHSHPSGNPNPSQIDLETVFRTKRFHFIMGYPYNNINCVKCFDQLGNELKFKIIN